jgi:methionyl-tRNA formyltransferase
MRVPRRSGTLRAEPVPVSGKAACRYRKNRAKRATMRILLFSDNVAICQAFREYGLEADFACSPGSGLGTELCVKDAELSDYDLIISGHCKQIFPKALVESVKCVNLHPGFNPEGRGWYPQVWAIKDGTRAGFTVHIMTAAIDDGPILYQEEVPVLFRDTSRTLYERILRAEMDSLPKWLPDLIAGKLKARNPGAGRYHSQADFAQVCAIDLTRKGTFREFYDGLRATSFPPYNNAFVIDPETGDQIFIPARNIGV